MRRLGRSCFFIALTILGSRAPVAVADDGSRLQAVRLRQELRFEENLGQWEPDVRFVCRARGYTLFLTRKELIFALREGRDRPSPREMLNTEHRTEPSAVHLVRMTPVGVDPGVELVADHELPGRSNYFIGNDPAKWRAGVRAFATVEYRGLYPGIDLILGERAGEIEYQLRMAPGVDPRTVAFDVGGAASVQVDDGGGLVVSVPGGELRHSRPITLTAHDAFRGEFRVVGNAVGFGSTAASPTGAIIDPVLTYSTYLGGNDDDDAQGVALDSAGNIYVGGQTSSTNFPVVNPMQSTRRGSQEGFVSKFQPDGAALVYSTYLGGSNIDYPGGDVPVAVEARRVAAAPRPARMLVEQTRPSGWTRSRR